MALSGAPYRKLPGRLRGVGYGATVWMGPDHVLLARTRMFREEYKRFYLRDVQAIVVAQHARFHLSIRAIAIGFLWFFPWLFFVFWPPGFTAVWSALGLALIATWLVFSAAYGCTCRLYTAVSNEELPSLYRTWTARKFLAEVKPRIDEAQGAVEGNWIEAVESRQAGPVPMAPAGVTPAAPAAGATESHATAVSDAFIASLLIGGMVDFLTLHSVTNSVRWIGAGLGLLQVALAVLVLIQYYRRVLNAAMQRLAIAALVLMGCGYYAATTLTAVSANDQPAMFTPNATLMLPQFILLREIYSGLSILLALIGVVIILRGRARQPDIIYKEPESRSQEPE